MARPTNVYQLRANPSRPTQPAKYMVSTFKATKFFSNPIGYELNILA